MKLTKKDIKSFVDAINYHIQPTAEQQATQKLARAAQHYWTCNNPRHNHGVIKVSWDAPTDKKVEEQK